MKRGKQGYDSRIDESMGGRNRGSHIQSMKDRRDESRGMEKREDSRAYSGDREMDNTYHHHMAHAHHKYMASKHRKAMHQR